MDLAAMLAHPAVAWRRVLVPFDGSAPAWRALDDAVEIAGARGSTLCLLGVFDEARHVNGFEPAACVIDEVIPHARHQLEDKLQHARTHVMACGCRCDTKLVDGAVPDIGAIVERESAHWKADLVVVGTHGRRGIDRLVVGSVAEDILRHSQLPVLLVRTAARC
jgi:nucleotide-binding universal stress UspA family protein